MNVDDDITYHFVAKLKHHDDELALIIKGHLFIEYVINQMIKKQCKGSRDILRDNRAYTFAVKLQMVYEMGLVPEPIYQNVRRINKIRNELAHNLQIKTSVIDFKFYRDDGTELPMKRVYKGKKYPERHYIKMLCFATLSQLRNYFLKQFGEMPRYEVSEEKQTNYK